MFFLLSRAIVLIICSSALISCDVAESKQPDTTLVPTESITILPGNKRLRTPSFDDYEAVYTSGSSETGKFNVQARKTTDGKHLTMIDIITMKANVIVAQRIINLETHQAENFAQPYFAWGAEFVVGQSNENSYDWVRVPIGGGEPIRMHGELSNSGSVDDMFSPTLAALMPMEPGTTFRMPKTYARKGDYVSSEFDNYEVLRKEKLDLESNISCECWVIKKTPWAGPVEHFWVGRKAPFVFRRIRDEGGPRELVSDLLAFRTL